MKSELSTPTLRANSPGGKALFPNPSPLLNCFQKGAAKDDAHPGLGCCFLQSLDDAPSPFLSESGCPTPSCKGPNLDTKRTPSPVLLSARKAHRSSCGNLWSAELGRRTPQLLRVPRRPRGRVEFTDWEEPKKGVVPEGCSEVGEKTQIPNVLRHRASPFLGFNAEPFRCLKRGTLGRSGLTSGSFCDASLNRNRFSQNSIVVIPRASKWR